MPVAAPQAAAVAATAHVVLRGEVRGGGATTVGCVAELEDAVGPRLPSKGALVANLEFELLLVLKYMGFLFGDTSRYFVGRMRLTFLKLTARHLPIASS